jgi:hypothetical protein
MGPGIAVYDMTHIFEPRSTHMIDTVK